LIRQLGDRSTHTEQPLRNRPEDVYPRKPELVATALRIDVVRNGLKTNPREFIPHWPQGYPSSGRQMTCTG